MQRQFESMVDLVETAAPRFRDPHRIDRIRTMAYKALAHWGKFKRGGRFAPQADNILSDLKSIQILLYAERKQNPDFDKGPGFDLDMLDSMLVALGQRVGEMASDWNFTPRIQLRPKRASTPSLRADLQKLASEKPELREHLVPLLRAATEG